MDLNERANKMARLVFNKGNLQQVKSGIDDLLDVFQDLLEPPFEHGNCFLHDEIVARLQALDQRKWRAIRNVFLLDPFHGYVQGGFTAQENESPAKLLLDLLALLDTMRQEITARLQGYQQTVAQITKDKRELEAQLLRHEQRASELRLATSAERSEMKAARSSLEYLERVVMEKNEKIAELQREKTVQLWGREKERAVAEHKKRMDFLESKNSELKRQNESLQKKMSVLEEQNKILKLKQELMVGEAALTPNKSEEELKRQVYLQEKDLTAMERELLTLQRMISTVLFGIKTDLFIVGENLTDPDTGQIPFKDFVRLTAMVDKLCKAMADGNIEAARGDLPPHYTYLPSDFKMKRVKRLSNLIKDRLPPIRIDRERETRGENDQRDSNQDADIGDAIIENPHLVDPSTNIVHFVNCMKHFPHLSLDFIKEHWAKFKEFDANGDQFLDFSEVVRALTAMGLVFTAQQAEEAMREADVNQSRTLDFYEYVLVADKLIHRTGRSELFHANPQDRKMLSKTCVLQ